MYTLTGVCADFRKKYANFDDLDPKTIMIGLHLSMFKVYNMGFINI